MVQVNLRYTGTSIYLHIFVLVWSLFDSVDVNAVVNTGTPVRKSERVNKNLFLGVA